MNPADLELRDIHLPDPISWWPPAIGWWMLLAGILCLIGAGAWWWRRRIAIRHAPATIARQELEQLRIAWFQHCNTQRLVNEVSTWLRRAGMSLSSRHQAAGVTGESWWRLLDEIAGETIFDDTEGRLLTQTPYQGIPAESASLDGEHLLDLCERWLNAASRRKQAP
jgi:hypothetical protein